MEASIATKLYPHQTVSAREAAYNEQVPRAVTFAVVRVYLTRLVTT